jgi:putative hemolysin
MTSILVEISLILCLVMVNGVFAMTEIAIVSARRGKLQALADQGNSGAARALELAESPNRFLSTVQIGITLVGIMAGFFGGASLSSRLAKVLEPVAGIGPYAGWIASGVVVTILTYLSLVVGELVPKRIAMKSPERIAVTMAKSMDLLSKGASWFVRFLSWSTDGLLKIVGIRETAEERMSREEFTVLIREGLVAGALEKPESRMMEGVFNFKDLEVYDIMIPRPKIVWIDIDSKHDEVWETLVKSSQTHFPVHEGRRDNLVGVVSLKDLYARQAAGLDISFREVMTAPLLVPEIQKASSVLEKFRETGIHVAFVIDEFGGVSGMATLIDLMESIVGDVPSVEERAVFSITQREDGSWLVDGLFDIEKLPDYLEDFVAPEGAGDRFQTPSGLFSTRLQRVPREGDQLVEGGWRFEIVDMDGVRVDKVLATPSKETQGPG